MKYNEGDKVRIKSKEWYNNNKDEYGNVHLTNKYGWMFTERDSRFCGKVVTILSKGTTSYAIIEDGCEGFWTDEMIECKVEESKPNIIKEAKTYWDSIKDAWVCPEGYQFKDENGNVINATKIVLEKKKKEYPKTYEECLKVLGYDDRETYCIFHTGADERLFEALYRLKVCRDAYWKIAGEEMGLGKPWEPNWGKGACYTICCNTNQIVIGTDKFRNSILTFPTEEMRDAFYENFKSEIESCKEFL